MAIRIVESNKFEVDEPIFFRPMQLAHDYCKGQGIELGAAAHNSFELPGSKNIAPYTAGVLPDELISHQQSEEIRICGHYAVVDIEGHATAIPCDKHSQDYIISSHVIEHVPNIIKAFLHWNNIIKPGGIVFMIFPKRDALESDACRPITPLAEFISHYENNVDVYTHPGTEPGNYGQHFHVFDLRSMLRAILWANKHLNLGWEILITEETDSKVSNGHTIIARTSSDHGSSR